MKAILILAKTKDNENSQNEKEIRQLIETLNIKVVAICRTRTDRSDRHRYLSPEEMIMITLVNNGRTKADCIIVNDNLTNGQLNHLQQQLGLPVYDRSRVIIESIFVTATSKGVLLHSLIAKLRYQKRHHPTIYLKKGEDDPSKLERKKQEDLFRARIDEELKEKEAELSKLQKKQERQKQARNDSDLPHVAIIGYTNSGKSTLLNSLLARSHQKEDKKVPVEDRLFTTLDTATRLIDIDGYPSFFVTDTMGFIENGPKELDTLYYSTLAAIKEAEVIINVVDISKDNYPQQVQIATEFTDGAGDGLGSCITLYNKCDLLSTWPFIPDENSLFVSLSNEEDIDDIINMIFKSLKFLWDDFKLILPYEKSLYELKKDAYITSIKELEDGYFVEGYMIPSRTPKWDEFMQAAYDRGL